jgi:RNA 2',3'-cyclic 3'-phosphodiesterase
MRLFVALDLPDEVRTNLVDVVDACKRLAPEGARWVRPEGIHITLKFIGHIEDARLPEFLGALANMHCDSPIEVDVRGIGFFPNVKRPRVMWCGVTASPSLRRLAEKIESALEPLGIARESREFTPHLTLARINSTPQQMAPLLAAAEGLADRELGTMRATEFHLYESILQRGGSVYRKVETFMFMKGAR